MGVEMIQHQQKEREGNRQQKIGQENVILTYRVIFLSSFSLRTDDYVCVVS